MTPMAESAYATGWTTRRVNVGGDWINEPMQAHAIERGAALDTPVKALCGVLVTVVSAGDSWPTGTLNDRPDCPTCTARARS